MDVVHRVGDAHIHAAVPHQRRQNLPQGVLVSAGPGEVDHHAEHLLIAKAEIALNLRGKGVVQRLVRSDGQGFALVADFQAQVGIHGRPVQNAQGGLKIPVIHVRAVHQIDEGVLQTPVAPAGIHFDVLDELDGVFRQILRRLILPRQQQGANLVDQQPPAVDIVAEQVHIQASHGVGILLVVPDGGGVIFQCFLVIFVVLEFVDQPQGDVQLAGVLVILKFEHALDLGGQGDHGEHVVVDVNGVLEKSAAGPAQIHQRAAAGDNIVQLGFEIVIVLKNGNDFV